MKAKRLFTLTLAAALMSGSLSAEVFPEKRGFDRFGGYLSRKGTATGRFLGTFGRGDSPPSP